MWAFYALNNVWLKWHFSFPCPYSYSSRSLLFSDSRGLFSLIFSGGIPLSMLYCFKERLNIKLWIDLNSCLGSGSTVGEKVKKILQWIHANIQWRDWAYSSPHFRKFKWKILVSPRLLRISGYRHLILGNLMKDFGITKAFEDIRDTQGIWERDEKKNPKLIKKEERKILWELLYRKYEDNCNSLNLAKIYWEKR